MQDLSRLLPKSNGLRYESPNRLLSLYSSRDLVKTFQLTTGNQKLTPSPAVSLSVTVYRGRTSIIEAVLRALELSNFAIVDALRLDLSPGLNVLTGETGAGKSILIDALALLIGGRGDSSWIRSGSDSALIQGLFARTPVESAARRLSRSGRSTARIDGELVTIGELAERLGGLATLHGQHASQVLLNAAEQRKLLDRQLGETARRRLNAYRSAYADYVRTLRALEKLREATRERARRMDILQFQIDEIDAARLQAGELEALGEALESLRFAERIVSSAGGALTTLSEGESNVSDLLGGAVKELESAGRYHKALASLAQELADALLSVEAISGEISSFLDGFDAEPGALESAESRLAAIETLQRKYGESIPAILDYREQASAELETLANADANVAALEREETELLTTLSELARDLTKARQSAAKRLSKEVTRELRPLGMDKASFSVELTPQDLSAHGADGVRFLFSANLGEPLAPLSSVASGGELSRVMLGLNVVTGSDLPILAFDEVDAGIGGKTALTVGRLLKQLAQEHQVLVVTHLPQVAAFADAQFYVEKREQGGRTLTHVTRLEPHERELELARMLSGSSSDAALANARELLQTSQQTSQQA